MGGLGAELGLVGDENLGGHNGWGGRGMFWQQAAAGLCVGITFPLGCFPSSDTSTKPSEPALSLWEPLCFFVTYSTLIADLRSSDPFVLAFLPSSIPSLVLGLTKVT